MKKLFLLLVLCSQYAFCQELPEGIGPYKIDKLTIDQFDSIAKIKKLKAIKCIGRNCAFNNRKVLNSYIKIYPNFEDIADNNYSDYLIPNGLIVSVKNLTIGNKYKIKDAELLFVDDILQQFTFTEPSGNLISDIQTKFGDGKITSSDTQERCYIDDESLPFVKEYYFRDWQNNNIKLSHTIVSTRSDDGCHPKIIRFTKAYNSYVIIHIESVSNEEKTRLESKSKTEKINMLKDL